MRNLIIILLLLTSLQAYPCKEQVTIKSENIKEFKVTECNSTKRFYLILKSGLVYELYSEAQIEAIASQYYYGIAVITFKRKLNKCKS